MANSKDLPYEQRRDTDLFRKNKMKAMVRDGFVCQMEDCQESSLGKLTVHHIWPLAEGGDNSVANLITLCEDCHTKIHAKKGGPALFRRTWQREA